MKIVKIIIILMVFCINTSFAETFNLTISSGNNFEIAKFRLWIPDMDSQVKALLVIVPGFNSDGRDEVNDSTWLDFARKNKLGIVACFFKDYKNAEVYYREASKGSGQALLDGIAQFALQTNQPKIIDLPLILWGFSAGGQYIYEFVCWNPEKVLTFVVNKGGYYHTAIASEATRHTPGIFFVGRNDLYYRKNMIIGIFSVNRKFGALWTLIEENTKHEIGDSKLLSISYFNNIIPIRFTEEGQFVDLYSSECYLGNWETKGFTKCSGQKEYDFLTVWLPNYPFAKIWKNQSD